MKISKISFLILLISISFKVFSITPDQLMKIDYSKNYKSKNVNELRLIRSMVYAKHGYLFMESELRNYFMSNFNWYDTLIYKNAELYWKEDGLKITLTNDEKEFIDKIDRLISEKSLENYYLKDSTYLPHLNNLYNRFDEKNYSDNFIKHLDKYGFIIVKDSLEQLFHLYDKNQYTNIPSFITTDLFLQLLHSYFAYTLKDIEKEKLVGLVTMLSDCMYKESLAKYLTSNNAEIKQMAKFNTCFFAIAYSLMQDKEINVPKEIYDVYKEELNNIKSQSDDISVLFKSFLPYSLFIPRGHYTRNEEQKRYFKTMIWLQIAPYCLSDNSLLKNACFNAFILKTGKDYLNKPIINTYNAIYEPIAYLIGDADNLSIKDIINVYEKYNINNIELLSQKKIIDVVSMKLNEIVRDRDQIQPKIKLACFPKINFMPQRYLVDNDILQQFVDTMKNAEKAFPKGLEVFSVFGINKAKDILYNHFKENKKWKPYDSIMAQQIEKFSDFKNWDATVYNKWLQCLIKLNKVDKTYPHFMQNNGWAIKNLNTALASWTELKHDVILYGEQPMAAEMGAGGDFPPPITVGYVEPNLDFWYACDQMYLKCYAFLVKYQLNTKELDQKSKKVKEILDFFINVSKKELNNQTLTEEEYRKIEYISGDFDYLSLSLLSPYETPSGWYNVIGPDKTIALTADVYTRNVPDCPKNAILHEATGFGNAIYVIVEIGGHLFLTKGATFSYYEFPYENRITDEKWYELLQQGKFHQVDWINEIMISENEKK